MNLEAVTHVPTHIGHGLAAGQLERVGGVLRESDSKQIVAWLREGGEIAGNQDIANGLLKTVLEASGNNMQAFVSEASNMAATAQSHYQIMREVQSLKNMMGFVGGLGLLNIAATAVSTTVILKGLSDLEKKIAELYEHVSSEFSRDRQVKLETAIQAATEALRMDNQSNRSWQANQAASMLFAARQHIWRDIETLKGSAREDAKNQLLQNNILQAMRLDSLRSRCLLEIDELARAKACLADNLAQYHEATRLLSRRLFGEYRAVYFHKSVPEEAFFRYLAIEQWLRGSGDVLLETVLSNRHDFWNADVLHQAKIAESGRSLFHQLRGAAEEDESPHIQALDQAELLIENYQRYQGFLAEIAAIEAMGISHAAWEKQQTDALARAGIDLAHHNDYVALMDSGVQRDDEPMWR